MEAKSEAELPTGPWQYEPKWDGFRCIAFKAGGEVALMSRSGKPLTRYFPEMVRHLAALDPPSFVLDGELAVPLGKSLDFDALQARVHPAASRIAKLAVETPAVFIVFDCLSEDGVASLRVAPLVERRRALERFFASLPHHTGLRLSPCTTDRAEAEGWLDRAGGAIDGVVAKRRDGSYEAGERAMVKVKHLRGADCVVGGFRYASKGEAEHKQVGSLLLGLYNEAGKLDHVGFTSGFAGLDRAELTARLEAHVGVPGFTGDAPGGPSRWSDRTADWQPLRPDLVVEVRYDHVTGRRFRHGTKLLRFRPDKAPHQCTFEQLRQEARPAALMAALRDG